MPPPPLSGTGRFMLPNSAVVDRVDHILSVCRGKRVIHAGFWGTEGIRENAVAHGLWLHAQLAPVARELVGLDVNSRGVQLARAQGFEAYAADLCDPMAVAELRLAPAEVLVAGELIEHLDRPGAFLDAIQPLVSTSGVLIITTPNAYCLSNSVRALRRREVINRDHVALYSWYTLTNILGRHGWQINWFGVYRNPRGTTLRTRLVFAFYDVATRMSPFVAHGLVAICGHAQSGT